MKLPKYTGNEVDYLHQAIDGESAPNGQTWCNSLETTFAEKFNAKYAIAMNSGTGTLHAALEAVGVGHGDEVICPAVTVIMNTTTVWQCNAIPVYADIDPHTWLIDPDDIERKITDKTKAIVVVSLYCCSDTSTASFIASCFFPRRNKSKSTPFENLQGRSVYQKDPT